MSQLIGDRVAVPRADVRPIGALDAITMFVDFLVVAIGRAPGAWARAIYQKWSAKAADVLQRQVFGRDQSAYNVIVNGITASGQQASWFDVQAAAGSIEDALSDAGATVLGQQGPASLSRLWSDYVDGALSLADAGERVAELPVPTVDSKRAVMRWARDVVPDSSHRFCGFEAELGAILPNQQVASYDVLGAKALDDNLKTVIERQGLRREADRGRGSLRDWARNYEATYATIFGKLLGKLIIETREEVAACLSSLREAETAEPDSLELARNKRLARKLRWLLLVGVVAAAVVLLLVVAGVLGMVLGAVLALFGLVVAVSGTFGVFLAGQRDLFQFINRQKTAAAAAEVTAENLRRATIDLRRQTDAYAQFLQWSAVLGAFLAEPFGRSSDDSAVASRLAPPLPRWVRIGEVEMDDETLGVVRRLANDLRAEVFQWGWLSKPWQECLERAPSRIPIELASELDPPTLLYGATGAVGSPLEVWSEAMSGEGNKTKAGDLFWSGICQRVISRTTDAEALFRRIRVEQGSGSEAIEWARFMSDVGSSTIPEGVFKTSLVKARAVVIDRGTRVERHHLVERREGLGWLAVLTEFSYSIDCKEFHLACTCDECSGTEAPASGAAVADPCLDPRVTF